MDMEIEPGTTAFHPSDIAALEAYLNEEVNEPDEIELVRMKQPKQDRFDAILAYPDTIRAELCKRDFAVFIKEFWEAINDEPLDWNWHIDILADELMYIARQVALRKPKHHDLIINIPPGTTKSTICAIMFPVWCWINWYWLRFITCSYSAPLSLEHAEHSRNVIRSDKFRAFFPDLSIMRDKDAKGNFRIQRTTVDAQGIETAHMGGNRFSTSVGGTVTGFHADIIIIDDPLNPEQASSEVELLNANNFVNKTLSTRKVNKAVTATVLIMQRLHQDDPTGNKLKTKKGKVKHICLPGTLQDYSGQVKPAELKDRYIDGLLDPKRLTQDTLDEMIQELGQYEFAGQVGQKPTPPGGGMFKVDNLVIMTMMPTDGLIKLRARYWDKAGTQGGDGAKTAGIRMVRLKNGKFLITDAKVGRWATEQREAIIKNQAEADGRNTIVYIEQEPGSGGKESAEATIRNLAGFSCRADRPTGDKVFRADPFSVQVNIGNVMLLQGAWNDAFIDELRYFPFGRYKDQVDAASGAFNKLAKKRRAGSLLGKRR